jgi:F420H(2)-dependent quinone reductase
MSNAAARPPRVPPPWFVHTAWRAHRALYRLSGGRFLWTTSNKRGWGALHLTTIGRRSGQERSVIVGYVEDSPNLVALAMNGWDEGHAAWCSTSRRTRTPLFDWRISNRAGCAHALR